MSASQGPDTCGFDLFGEVGGSEIRIEGEGEGEDVAHGGDGADGGAARSDFCDYVGGVHLSGTENGGEGYAGKVIGESIEGEPFWLVAGLKGRGGVRDAEVPSVGKDLDYFGFEETDCCTFYCSDHFYWIQECCDFLWCGLDWSVVTRGVA